MPLLCKYVLLMLLMRLVLPSSTSCAHCGGNSDIRTMLMLVGSCCRIHSSLFSVKKQRAYTCIFWPTNCRL